MVINRYVRASGAREPQMWYDVVSAISNLVMAAFAVIAGIYAKGQHDEDKQQRELALRQEEQRYE